MERRLLRWQETAQAGYLEALRKDFLLVAVPGAGKTFWTMHTARELIRAGRVERLAIVAPTRHVKLQWAQTAHELGLNIESDYRNSDGAWPADADGISMTYAQMHEQRSLHRQNVSRRSTLVIMDEVHHLQESGGWGQAALEAFDLAAYRIHLSGTPWNKEGFIPWVEYGPDGKVEANAKYTYREALADNVICDVYFPKFGARAEWEFDGKRFKSTFEDQVSEADRARRLAAVIALPESDFIENAFKQADEELDHIRNTALPRAGGIIMAKDIDHAKQCADLVQRVSGRRPPVVASDDKNATTLIRNFRDGSGRWLVAVRMVSEGVDIPRLRVLVYATNVVQRLFFQQAVGRVVRGTTPPAAVFLPADPKLLALAKEIRDERVEALRQVKESIDEGTERREWTSTFRPVSGQATADGVIHDDQAITQSEVDRADQEIRRAGGISNTEMRTIVAKILRQQGLPLSQSQSEQPPASDSPLQSDRKKALQGGINRFVRSHCEQTGDDYGAVWTKIHAEADDGVKTLRKCTEEQLKVRYDIVKKFYL